MTLRWKIEQQKEQEQLEELYKSVFCPEPVTPDWCEFFGVFEEEEIKEPVVENFVASNWKYEWDSDEEIRLEKSYTDTDDDLVADDTFKDMDMVDTSMVDKHVDTSMVDKHVDTSRINSKKVDTSIDTLKHVHNTSFAKKEADLQKKVQKHRIKKQKLQAIRENNDIAMKWSRQTEMSVKSLKCTRMVVWLCIAFEDFFWHCFLFSQGSM